MSEERRIHVLDKVTASKIAAGEVIDRTSSVVRELLDNAIDAGATEISVYLTGGGIKEIRVIDNGCGMSRGDLDSKYNNFSHAQQIFFRSTSPPFRHEASTAFLQYFFSVVLKNYGRTVLPAPYQFRPAATPSATQANSSPKHNRL